VRAVLAFLLRGRLHATLAAALGLLVPPLSIASAGLIGLVTLRHGALGGVQVLAGSAAIAALLWSVVGSADPVILFVVMTGLPVLGLCAVLRATASQGITLAAAGLGGALLIAMLHLLTGDPARWWRGVLEGLVIGRMSGGEALSPEAMEGLRQVLDVLAPLMVSLPTGVVAASMMMVLLARWWHAVLDRPGGFRREFRALRLDRRLAVPSVLVVALALVASDFLGGLWPALMELALVVYAFQGIAVVHAVVALREAPHGWLVGMYVLLVLMPPMATTVLAITGLTDAWLDYRRRAGGGT